MAHRIVEKSPGPFSRWFVALDGHSGSVSFRLHEATLWDPDGANHRFQSAYDEPTLDIADVAPVLLGTVNFVGVIHAEMPHRHLGNIDDVAELHQAWLWALAQARQLMLDEGGFVHWGVDK